MIDIEKIGLIAQKISFAFEDDFHDLDKRKLYNTIFDKYLSEVDPGVMTDPYDAIVSLGRTKLESFEKFLEALKEKGLVSDL